jgi:uncharacterized protein
VSQPKPLHRLVGLAPRDRPFYALYERAGDNIERATRLLEDHIRSWPDASPEIRLAITECEHEGDRITHDIMHHLHTKAFTPLPSREAHELASELDDVVDFAEEAADLFHLYRIEAPTDQAVELAEILRRAGAEIAAAMHKLSQPRETRSHTVTIDGLEHDGDRAVRAAIAALFDGGIDPMVVIRMKDVYERLENAIDACDDVAHTLEGLRHTV